MNSSRAINTYPDIGQAAFGQWGRMLVSVLLYMELFCCCVDFLILEGDNLSAVFPTAGAAIAGRSFSAKEVGVGWPLNGELPCGCAVSLL